MKDKAYKRWGCLSVVIGTLAFWVALIALIVGCQSCTTTKYIPVESVVTRTDTIYTAKLRIDTIMERDSVVVYQKGDTIYQTKYIEKLRVRERVDTLYQVVADSVKVVVPYPVERELTWWERTKMDFGGMALGLMSVLVCAVIVWLIIKNRNK